MCRSVWQTPQPATRMRISVPVGSGIGSSSKRSGSPAAWLRTASIGLARWEDRLEQAGDQALGGGPLDDVQDGAVNANREGGLLRVDVAAL